MSRRVFKVNSKPLAAALGRLTQAGRTAAAVELGAYRVELVPSNGRLYVRSATHHLGLIFPSGRFRPNSYARKKDIEAVKLLVERTLEVARGAALLTGSKMTCIVCGRALDQEDGPRGIGRSCWEKGKFWKLPIGKEITAAGERSGKIAKSTRKNHHKRRH